MAAHGGHVRAVDPASGTGRGRRLGPLESIEDPALKNELRQLIMDTWFDGFPAEFVQANISERDINAFERYNQCVNFVIPWIQRELGLTGKDVVEIGCGVGSATAAMAALARRVHGYDIDLRSIRTARARMDFLLLENVLLTQEPAENILSRVRADHPDGYDVCFLYAVLEHQTLDERFETLRTAWSLLRDGGLLAVVETPNRLTFTDVHTSFLPFFNALPDDLAVLYAEHSPREQFRDEMRAAQAQSRDAALLRLTRWGRGVSFHEFELVFGDLGDLVVASGYEPEMLALYPLRAEEALLQQFFLDNDIHAPWAFTRHYLNLMMRKGAPPSRPAPRAGSREQPLVPVEQLREQEARHTEQLREREACHSEQLREQEARSLERLREQESRYDDLEQRHRALHEQLGVTRHQLGAARQQLALLARSPAVRLHRRLTRYPLVRRVLSEGFVVAERLHRRLTWIMSRFSRGAPGG